MFNMVLNVPLVFCKSFIKIFKQEKLWFGISFYSVITTIKFGTKIAAFYDKSNFVKPFVTCSNTLRLFIIKPLSHTENQSLQFFLRFKKLSKITKKLITKVHRAQQIMTKTHSNRQRLDVLFDLLMAYI